MIATFSLWTVPIIWCALSLLIGAVVSTVEFFNGSLEKFRDHISTCVVEGKCPVKESAFHRKREQYAYAVIWRYGMPGVFMALWGTWAIVLMLLPILGPLEIVLDKRII